MDLLFFLTALLHCVFIDLGCSRWPELSTGLQMRYRWATYGTISVHSRKVTRSCGCSSPMLCLLIPCQQSSALLCHMPGNALCVLITQVLLLTGTANSFSRPVAFPAHKVCSMLFTAYDTAQLWFPTHFSNYKSFYSDVSGMSQITSKASKWNWKGKQGIVNSSFADLQGGHLSLQFWLSSFPARYF